jgi:hypothetical protein
VRAWTSVFEWQSPMMRRSSSFRDGTAGVREWNRRRNAGEEIPEFRGAVLSNAFLSEVDLSGASLRSANLQRANLGRPQRRRPRWDESLALTDLSTARTLTREQVASACADPTWPPELPRGFELPPPCPEESFS